MPPEHLLPHFFIIGERKCGTSSLYRYLLTHPNVLPGTRKEMQFFTQSTAEIQTGFGDYLKQFPLKNDSRDVSLMWPELDDSGRLYEEIIHFRRVRGRRYVTGEASADTFCDVSPALLHEYLPELRLILILRDPIERAFSHHRMFERFQAEGRDLGFVVGDFKSDMQSELARQRAGEETPCLSPGLYLPKLRSWHQTWGREALLVLFSSDFHQSANQTFIHSVVEHLALPKHDFAEVLETQFNRAPSARVPPEICAELESFYEPHSQALRDYLGVPVPWLAL